MRIIFYSSLLLILLMGCQQQQSVSDNEPEKEKTLIYVVQSNQSPVQGFIITLSETGDSAPDSGIELPPTDEDGKTEVTLDVGTTYEAYLVIDDNTTQYEEFTVSKNVEENEFTFILENQ